MNKLGYTLRKAELGGMIFAHQQKKRAKKQLFLIVCE
jgi:hypothetical protein